MNLPEVETRIIRILYEDAVGLASLLLNAQWQQGKRFAKRPILKGLVADRVFHGRGGQEPEGL